MAKAPPGEHSLSASTGGTSSAGVGISRKNSFPGRVLLASPRSPERLSELPPHCPRGQPASGPAEGPLVPSPALSSSLFTTDEKNVSDFPLSTLSSERASLGKSPFTGSRGSYGGSDPHDISSQHRETGTGHSPAWIPGPYAGPSQVGVSRTTAWAPSCFGN